MSTTRLRAHAPALAILALALLASGLSLANGFAYDDVPIITLNRRAQSLAGWWHRFNEAYWPPRWGNQAYRPLTILGFALQFTLSGGKPWLFHVVNIVAYGACCLVVLRLARRVLPERGALLASALFAVHPVHVEAVANIVGQAELLAALTVLIALDLYLERRMAAEFPGMKRALAIAALFAVGCLTKETAIVLPGLFLAAELTVVSRTPFASRVRALAPSWGAVALVAVLYLVGRASVLGSSAGVTPFVPFAVGRTSPGDRLLTMLGVVPEWVRLLLWPARLSAEYGVAEMQIATGPALWQLPGLVLLCAIVIIAVMAVRRAPVVTFGILLAAVAIFPVSNVVFITSILLAERTLFLASVGAMLVVGWALDRLFVRAEDASPRARTLVGAMIALLLVAGVARSAVRQRAWKDSDTIFAQTAIDAPRNYRAQFLQGAQRFVNGDKAGGERQMRIALGIYGDDPNMLEHLGDLYRTEGMCEPAIPLYQRAVTIWPQRSTSRTGLVTCLVDRGRFDEAREVAQRGIREGIQRDSFRRLLAITDSVESSRRGAAGSAARSP